MLRLVEDEREIGEGLTIIPAPGETPGHQILRVLNSGHEAFFTGDLYHHPLEFYEDERNDYWATEEDIQASKMNLIQRAANSKADVYFSLIEGPSRLKRKDGSLAWQFARAEHIAENSRKPYIANN
ncbi:MAG: hypothetical protein IIC78_10945 [Chloroflexi bacterium]|nr:hypothetical protein [Chloroflexota bacterium]